MNDESYTYDTFLEWTKEIFKTENLTGIPRKIIVFSVETAQKFVDMGMPIENIEVMKPLKMKGKIITKRAVVTDDYIQAGISPGGPLKKKSELYLRQHKPKPKKK